MRQLLFLCSLFSYSYAQHYQFNFYVAQEKITINCDGISAWVSIDNEPIKCFCGKDPIRILKVDNQLSAFCQEHHKSVEPNGKLFECDDVDSDNIVQEIRPRSSKSSSHRSTE